MGKYLLKRLLHGIISIIIVVIIVMIMIFSLLNREFIFQNDSVYTKRNENDKIVYKYKKWQDYGYLKYIDYTDYLVEQKAAGNISEEDRAEAAKIGYTELQDTAITRKWVANFESTYKAQGYEIVRLDAVLLGGDRGIKSGGSPYIFATKERNVFVRIWEYFTNLIQFDNIHYASGDVGDRGIKFTFFDPVYGGDTFSPAIIGNGTKHKYLLYFDSHFPFIHQNLITISLGKSYSINRGIDIATTMVESQGSLVQSETIYPTGYVGMSSDNLHSAEYVQGSNNSDVLRTKFDDDYTQVSSNKVAMSRLGFSFVIGIISVILAYLVAVPLGILMARKKDKIADKIGTIYIVFILAVPSLAYILMFKSIGQSIGLPGTFDIEQSTFPYFVLPVISLALPSIASLMKWLRRYMIDQMNSDYVKFARSGGLSDSEIFRKHIFKNAAIPIVHGIPGSVLTCMTGAIITESVYVVPGTGKFLTNAINFYDNSVIVGVAFFYAILSVISLILGDILMALMDPRISFSTKGR